MSEFDRLARELEARIDRLVEATIARLGERVAPEVMQATFTQPLATTNGPYDYTRSGNPTRAQLEAQMADLEV